VTDPPPLAYRISPAQTALLILFSIPCFAANLYWHPSTAVRVVTLALGLAALALAVASRRMYLAVDDEGVAVRWLGREQWLPWADISSMEVVSGVRGGDTIRIHRTGGAPVDVPPSLLQPSRPTARTTARRRLHDTLRQIETRRTP
jgi:hypothetical protein